MVVLNTGEEFVADLVVGADGVNSQLREILLGRPDPPTLTGDLAYRLLLSTIDIQDPELADFVKKPQVNYWLGPDAHAGEGRFTTPSQIYSVPTKSVSSQLCPPRWRAS